MKSNHKEPLLTYALNASGRMVHINDVNDVKRGLACNCFCPKCNEPLEAKLGYGGRQPHFSHGKGADCSGSYMTALHKLAEQILKEEKAVMVPAYKSIDGCILAFERVEIEQRVERKDLQPDIVGITADGLRWFVEIRNTHEVDERKRNKLRESDITCLEIDVREQTLENLKSFLLDSANSREWLNNPIYEKRVTEINRNRVSEIVKRLLDNPVLRVYAGEDVVLKDHSVSISEDRLYASVKAISSNGVPYLFHIGNNDVIAHILPRRDCNEFTIDTEKYISNEGPIPVSEMGIKYRLGIIRSQYSHNYLDSAETKNVSYSYKKMRGVDVANLVNSPKRRPIEESGSLGSKQIDVLPLERPELVEEYYKQLLSAEYYKTDEGYIADIVRCDETKMGIILLYKDNPAEIRTYLPFHIVIISSKNGNLSRNKVADFTNEKTAIVQYNNRLKAMRENVYLNRTLGDAQGGLPF